MGLRFASFLYSSREVKGRWSIVLFLQGCNFRCRHCHNWRLALSLERETIQEDAVIEEIKSNPFIDCLVISGGEPSLQPPEKIASFLERVRSVKKELKIRIDTNGSRPSFVKELRAITDGFAVDIKSPLDDKELYSYTAGVPVNTEAVKESAHLADGMELTLFRTVRYPWLGKRELERIREFTYSLCSPGELNPFFPVPSCPFNH